MKKRIQLFLIIIILLSSSRNLLAESTVDELNTKINEYTIKLNELGKSKNTLANQISILNSQVALTLLKINQTELSIKTIETEIIDLTDRIGKLDTSLNQLSLVYIDQVSQNYKLSKRFPITSLFTSGNFNQFLEQFKYLSVIQKNSQETLLNLETARTNFDIQKEQKKQKQVELEALQKKLAEQQSSLAKQKIAKNNLLETTKNDEKRYQQLLTEAQNQLRQFKNFSSTAGGSSCLSSSPGRGNDGLFFSQRDPIWCKQFMGNSRDTIGEVGCYISSISIVFKKLGSNISPPIYAADPSNFSFNTAYAKVPNPPSDYRYSQVSYSSNTVDNELRSGHYVIAQIRMSGSVSGMHFVVLIGGSNGNYKMHDPWYGPDINFSDHYSTSQILSLRLFNK